LRVSARTCNVQNSDYQLPQSPLLVSVQLRLSMAEYNFARSSGHGYTLDPASKQSTALFSRCSHRSRSPLQPGEGPPSATAVVPSTSRGYGLRALPLVAGCSGNMTVTLRDSTVARVSIVPPHSAECSEFAARWSGSHSYPLDCLRALAVQAQILSCGGQAIACNQIFALPEDGDVLTALVPCPPGTDRAQESTPLSPRFNGRGSFRWAA